MKHNFFGNQYVKKYGIGSELARAYKKYMSIVSILIAGAYLVTMGIYIAKWSIKPVTVYGKEIVEVPVKSIPPVMQRIAKCESGNAHTKNGQVIVNVNSNGTYDTGRYQINSIWNKKATELGYNLSNEKDNEAFAMYLYENYGTQPWESSRPNCWNR